MKQFLEEYGLNLLGDTIAGFLGLATFIVVVITYFAQKAMAKQTIRQMEVQNRLSVDIANANYKMSLFDKRRKAYEHFIDARTSYVVGGGKDLNVIHALKNALSEAKFVYDQDMNYRLLELANQAGALHMMARAQEVKTEKNSKGQLTAAEQEQFEKDFELFDQISQKMFKDLFDQDLMEMFYKRLKLLEEIGVINETARKQ